MACRWDVTPEQYTEQSVGSKCYTLERLAQALPHCIATPASAALPFAALERVLALQENAEAHRVAQMAADSVVHPGVDMLEKVRGQSSKRNSCWSRLQCFAM
jgi:hypothetical protein